MSEAPQRGAGEPASGSGGRGWLRRILRGCAALIIGGAGLLALLLLGLLLLLGTAPGQRMLRTQALGAVNGALTEGSLELGAIEVELDGEIGLEEVALRDAHGRVVLGGDSLRARVDLLALLDGRLHLTELHSRGLVVDLDMGAHGVLNLMQLFGQTEPSPPSTEPWAGLPLPIELDQVRLQGAAIRYASEGEPVVDLLLDGAVAVHGEGRRIEAKQLELAGVLTGLGPLPVRAQGDLVYTGETVEVPGLQLRVPGARGRLRGAVRDLSGNVVLDLDLGLDPIALPTLDPVLIGVGLRGAYVGELSARGPLSDLKLSALLEGRKATRGRIELAAQADLVGDPLSWKAQMGLTGVRVDDLYDVGGELMVDGVLELAGRGSAYPDDMVVDGHFVGGAQNLYGYPIDELDLAIRLEDGQLRVQDLSLFGLVGRVQASGGLDLQTGELEQRVRGQLRMADLAAFGVEGFGGQGPFQATIRGNVLAEGSPIQVQGQALVHKLSYGEEVQVERTTADFLVNIHDGDTTVQAQVKASQGVAYGVQIAEAALEDLQVEVREPGTRVELGRLQVRRVAMPETFALASISGGLRVELPSAGEMRVESGLNLGPLELIETHESSGGSLRVRMVGDRLSLTADLAAADQGRLPFLALSSELDLAEQQLRISRLAVSPTEGVALSNDGPQALRYTEDGLQQAQLALDFSTGARLEVEGDLGLSGPLDGRIEIQELELDTLSRLVPELGELDGMLMLSATARGRAQDPELVVQAAVRDASYGASVQGLDAQAGLSLIGGIASLHAVLGPESYPLLVLDGIMPLSLGEALPALDPDATLALTARVPPGGLDRAEPLAGPLPRGKLSGLLEVQGPLRNPDLHLRALSEVEVVRWDQPARVELDIERTGSRLQWWTDVRQGFEQLGSTVGVASNRLDELFAWALGEGPEVDLEDYGLFADDLDASLLVIDAPVGRVGAALGAPVSLGGSMVGGLVVEGRWFSPHIEGAFNWLDANIADVQLEGAYASFEPQEGGYLLDGILTFAEATPDPTQGDKKGEQEPAAPGFFTLGGDIPLQLDLRTDSAEWTQGELDLVLTGERVPVELLEGIDPGIRDAEGLLQVDGAISGPLDAIAPAIDLELEDGALSYLPLGVRYRDIDIDVRADEDAITLQRMQLYTDNLAGLSTPGASNRNTNRSPSLVVAGSMLLDDSGAPTKVDASVQLEEAWVSATPEQRVRLSGGFRASGDWTDEIRVRTAEGRALELNTGLLVLDAAAFLSTGPESLDEHIVVHRQVEVEEEEPADTQAVEEIEAAAAGEEESFMDRVRLDIDVDLMRAFELQASMPYIDDLGALGAAVTRADMSARLGGELSVSGALEDPAVVGEVEVIEGQVRVLQSQFELEEGSVAFTGRDYTDPEMSLQARMDVTGGSVSMAVEGTPSQPEIELTSQEYPDQTQIFTILLTGRGPEDISDDQGSATAGALAGLLLNSVIGGSRIGSVSLDPDGSIRVVLPPVASNVFAETMLNPGAGVDEDSYSITVEWAILRRLVMEASYGNVDKSAELFWEIRF